MDTRSQFLAEFLGALGAKEIRNLQVSPDSVTGTVIYDPADPDEQQDFRWSVGESSAPSPAAVRLAALIRRGGLLHGDKLWASRQDLCTRFNSGQDSPPSTEQFSELLGELLQVRVPMVDDGIETTTISFMSSGLMMRQAEIASLRRQQGRRSLPCCQLRAAIRLLRR